MIQNELIDLDSLPPRAVRIREGWGVLGPDREHLAAGAEYTLPGRFALQLIQEGRGIDVLTGEGAPASVTLDSHVGKYPRQVQFGKEEWVPRSGRKERCTVSSPFRFTGFDGDVYDWEGGEYEVPIELLPDDRFVRVGAKKKRQVARNYPGEPHPILIIGTPAPGMGINVPPLGHIEFGVEITVPDSIARELIFHGRAKSLRPDLPDPDAVELADLLVPATAKAKHAKVVELASKILSRRRS